MFVVVGTVGLFMGWVGLETRNIQQREAMLRWCDANGGRYWAPPERDPSVDPWTVCYPLPAPPKISWVRKLLGDQGFLEISFVDTEPAAEKQRELARLFPEAWLVWFDGDGNDHTFGWPAHAAGSGPGADSPATSADQP